MAQSYSVSLDTIVREHNLAIVNRAVDYDRVPDHHVGGLASGTAARPGFTITLTPHAYRSSASSRSLI